MAVDARIESVGDAYRGDGDVLRISVGGPSILERVAVLAFGVVITAFGAVPLVSGVPSSRWFLAFVFGTASAVAGILLVAWAVRSLVRPVVSPLVVRVARRYAEVARNGDAFERTPPIERIGVTRRVVDGAWEASLVAEAAAGQIVFRAPHLPPRDAETILVRIAEHLQLVVERRGHETTAALPAAASPEHTRDGAEPGG